MMLVKCPRCELNYIQENEKYCKICQRERHGEPIQDEMELCSICNAAPALPGKDVCLSCQKEILAGSREKLGEEPEAADENAMGLNSVSTMDEIIPQIHEDIPEREIDINWERAAQIREELGRLIQEIQNREGY